jgi:RNA polymerase sigma factor (sigma-70 family)
LPVTESRGHGFLIDVDSREDLTDDQLLAASRSDPEAFACFYERYETSIVGYLMRRTGDPELAADLTAEVFAAALTSAVRYRRRHPTAAAWLFTIAHNTLAKSARRGRVEERARRELGVRKVALREESLVRVEASASDDWVAELLGRLPAEQRDAVVARILDGRTYEDIASELETSELVVRKRVSRGLAALREEVERQHDPST